MNALTRRRSTVLAAGAAGALLLSACGGGSSSTTTAGADSSCAKMTPVTIMMGTSDLDISYAPYASLAKELGYFAEECLNVTVTTTGASTTTAQAVVSGAADIAIQTPDSMIAAAQTDPLSIKIFHNLVPRSSYEIAVVKGGKIKSDKDLANAKIGYPVVSDSNKAYVSARMKEAGADVKTTKDVATGFGATSAQALQSGKIDAFVGWPALWASFTNAGFTFDILPSPSWENDYYGIGLGATDAYIKAHPDVIEGVSRAVAKSTVYLKTNPTSAIKLFWAENPTQAPLPGDDETKALKQATTVLDATMQTMRLDDFPVDSPFGVQTTKAWANQIKYNKTAGLITKDLDPGLFFTDQFNAAANKFDHQAIVDQAKAAK
jgi:NitT/TauT family transport system substrate-binding protein